jgi:hypothetical protein
LIKSWLKDPGQVSSQPQSIRRKGVKTMKKWFGIITAMLATGILALSSVSVLAENGQEDVEAPASVHRPGLAIQAPRAAPIQAPRAAPVGETVTITVSDRLNQEAVKDADVWALTRDEATALREEVDALREQGTPRGEIDFPSLVTLIGTTNGNGQLHYAFSEPGGYLLVSVKADYLPGFARIHVITP